MAVSANPEFDHAEFLTFEYSKQAAYQSGDIDLTCYESFYDSSPSRVENGSFKVLHNKRDLQHLELFERNEVNIRYYSRVPDIDCLWVNRDGSMHDVLQLYNTVKRELFSDFSPEDIESCVVNSLPEPTILGLQQVPTLTNVTTDSLQLREEKAGAKAELSNERSPSPSFPPSQSSAVSAESDEDDARVPSSCVNDIITTGSYHIEE